MPQFDAGPLFPLRKCWPTAWVCRCRRFATVCAVRALRLGSSGSNACKNRHGICWGTAVTALQKLPRVWDSVMPRHFAAPSSAGTAVHPRDGITVRHGPAGPEGGAGSQGGRCFPTGFARRIGGCPAGNLLAGNRAAKCTQVSYSSEMAGQCSRRGLCFGNGNFHKIPAY